MKTEHAIIEAGEQATTGPSAGRPTPGYVKAARELLEAIDRSPTPCEACETSFASVVRGGNPPIVLCRYCAVTSGRSPLERRRLQLQIARGGRS